jgi:hypothetical protein
VKVLFFGSNPGASDRLRLDREYREIDRHLQEGGNRNAIQLVASWAIRVSDLSFELLRHEPDVVHFSGHGSADGLVFDTDSNDGYAASPESLANLFKVVASHRAIQAVLLNACFSEQQSQLIAHYVPFVVGTATTISDDAAIAFASGFYRGLTFGMDLGSSAELGRAEVTIRGLQEAAVFVVGSRDR